LFPASFFFVLQAMLHERDSKLLLLNPSDNTKVFCMDLDRGKVVEEWKVSQNSVAFGVNTVAPTEKYAQRTDDQMVLGVNNNMVFSLDPRQQNTIAQSKVYQKANIFSAVSASGDGRFFPALCFSAFGSSHCSVSLVQVLLLLVTRRVKSSSLMIFPRMPKLLCLV
jgi:hypothetical protein